MRAHLVVGGGEHAATVTDRVAASIPLRPAVRSHRAAAEGSDPVLEAIAHYLDRLLAALDLPAPVVADLVGRLLPAELATLLRLARSLDQAEVDDHGIVATVDIEVARLLDLPQRVARAFAAFVPVVARWEVLVAPEGVGNLPAPEPPVLTALREGADLLERLDAALADPEVTAVHLAPPDGPVGAARRADAEVLLALMGRTLTAVHPGGGSGVEHLPASPTEDLPSLERRGEEWLLHIGLPGVRAADLDLVRHDDELVLGCAGRTRRVLLPSVLRRCDIGRAGVAAGVLTLTMTPDERVWPRG
ncbi:ArsA family ATPase [Janibacter alittae]|uniref:ArsA HSP20-like domain-containing protein n=1 Tax=Janibacter alittae TaxID=3115209 RepID=A0ABZ2ML77_9MICO